MQTPSPIPPHLRTFKDALAHVHASMRADIKAQFPPFWKRDTGVLLLGILLMGATMGFTYSPLLHDAPRLKTGLTIFFVSLYFGAEAFLHRYSLYSKHPYYQTASRMDALHTIERSYEARSRAVDLLIEWARITHTQDHAMYREKGDRVQSANDRVRIVEELQDLRDYAGEASAYRGMRLLGKDLPRYDRAQSLNPPWDESRHVELWYAELVNSLQHETHTK